MESRFRIEKGETGEWRKSIIISSDNVLYGTYFFEFRYTCKENTSEVKALKVVVDPSLPDIFLELNPTLLLTDGFLFTLSFPNGEDDINNITDWKVKPKNGTSETVKSGESSRRFLVREEGEYTLSITNKREHTKTQSTSLQDLLYLT